MYVPQENMQVTVLPAHAHLHVHVPSLHMPYSSSLSNLYQLLKRSWDLVATLCISMYKDTATSLRIPFYLYAPSYANRTHSYRIRPTLLSPDAVCDSIFCRTREMSLSLFLSRWLYHVLSLILFLIASGSSHLDFDLAKPNGGAFSPRLKDAPFYLY